MAREVHLRTPLGEDDIRSLTVGDLVYLDGIVLTARDQAHLRLRKEIAEGNPAPEPLAGAAIFHAGPVVKIAGTSYQLEVIGPTTSIRMEPYSDFLCSLGVRCIIGKGGMAASTTEALRKHGGVYLHAAPGCAAKHSQAMEAIERVHWLDDLGMAEAMWVLRVHCWGPLIVGMDSHGGDLVRQIRQRGEAILAAL